MLKDNTMFPNIDEVSNVWKFKQGVIDSYKSKAHENVVMKVVITDKKNDVVHEFTSFDLLTSVQFDDVVSSENMLVGEVSIGRVSFGLFGSEFDETKDFKKMLDIDLSGSLTAQFIIGFPYEEVIETENVISYEFKKTRTYYLEQSERADDSFSISFSGMDKIGSLNEAHDEVEPIFPCTFQEYVNFKIESMGFKGFEQKLFNGDWVVESKPNYQNMTNQGIIGMLAKWSMSFACMGENDMIRFIDIKDMMSKDPILTLSKEQLIEYRALEGFYGQKGINTLTLALLSDVDSENASVNDNSMIEVDDVIELALYDTEFAPTDEIKRKAIGEMFAHIKGFKYNPYELKCDLPILQLGDLITQDADKKHGAYIVPILSRNVTFSGSSKSLYAADPSRSATTELKWESLPPNRRTEITVNKHDGIIKLLSEKTEQLEKDIENIDLSGLQIGGRNYLSNSERPEVEVEGDKPLKVSVSADNFTQIEKVGIEGNMIAEWISFGKNTINEAIKDIPQDSPVILSFFAKVNKGSVTNVPSVQLGDGYEFIKPKGKIETVWKRFFIKDIWKISDRSEKLYNIKFNFADIDVGTQIEFKKFQLETGTGMTDWSISDEEYQMILDAIKENILNNTTMIEENRSSIEQNDYKIQLEVEERIKSGEEILEEMAARLSLTKEELLLEFVSRDNAIDENGALINELRTYYRFDENGALIGKDGNPMQLSLANDEISFLLNGEKISYWQGKKMYVEALEVLNYIIIGQHIFESKGNRTIMRNINDN